MKLSRTVRHQTGLFVLIPLVNVLLLVFAFLTLSQSFIVQPGISIALPFSSFALGPQRNPLVVNITGGAAPLIYFDGQRITLEELDRALRDAGGRERALIVRADRSAPYEAVSHVMNLGLQHGYTVAAAAAAAP